MEAIEQIKLALADKNIAVVADRTGLSAQTIYRIYNGIETNPNRSTIKLLTGYLGIDDENLHEV